MRKCKAFDRAVDYLNRLVSDPETQTRLPPVRQLASDAQVSLVTMVKALKSLRSRGVLAMPVQRRTQPHREDVAAESPGGAQRSCSWTTIRDRIMQDIVSGSFRHTAVLPTPKEMRARYGGNYRTVRKAIDELRSLGVIVAHGRGNRLTQPTHRASRHEVLVFVYCESEDLYLSYLDPHLLRLLETMCHTANVRLTFVRYCDVGGVVRCTNHATGESWDPNQGHAVLGCIWLVLFPWDVLPDLCRKLLYMKKPVAVSGDPFRDAYPEAFRKNRSVKFFTHRDSSQFGRDVGQHLLGLGHRNIAFICTQMERPWAQARLDGLREAFALAGFPSAVTVHAVASTTKRVNLLVGEEIKPLLKQAYALSNCTAWVCSDDFEALAALSFLKRRNVPVPDKLSVVGFNNSLRALKANLTSYDHNSEAIVAAMFSYVLRPHSMGSFQRRKAIDFDGFVVERRSSGRAPATAR